MSDFVSLRASPDWLNFDLADAQPFLRAGGYPVDLLDRFVELWDSHFRVDYRTFRHKLKSLSRATALHTRALVIERSDLHLVKDRDRVVFLDDDDWLAPELFGTLKQNDQVDGQRWASVRIGLDYDPSSPHAAVVQNRPHSQIVYTNNYAVLGHSLRRFGIDAVFEHTPANHTFSLDEFHVEDYADYLSCAVKHPCCTTAMIALLKNAEFAKNPIRTVAYFADQLQAAAIPLGAEWLDTPLNDLRGLFRDTLGRT